jgi:hypothetical protein
MQSVVDLVVGQIKRNDFTAVGVDANVVFAPGTALRGPMLFKQPFARATQLQPRAIDNQVQFTGSISPVGMNRQTGRTPAQRRMIGNRQIDIQHAHD